MGNSAAIVENPSLGRGQSLHPHRNEILRSDAGRMRLPNTPILWISENSPAGGRGSGIAVCATFPAFIAPDQFPMVDRQIAKWVVNNAVSQNRGSHCSQCGVFLHPPRPFDQRKDVLKLSHYPFIESWIAWCGCQARRLTELSRRYCRARHVEMAIFTAQRLDPQLKLPPVP
jgi:hypothetical protein